jgi:phage-related protein
LNEPPLGKPGAVFLCSFAFSSDNFFYVKNICGVVVKKSWRCLHIYIYMYIMKNMQSPLKPLRWVASSKKDLMVMPEEVRDVFGFALHLAQAGQKHPDAKPLKGFGGAGVLEVIDDFQGDTYRAVYTVRIASEVFVLHCFQKKSTQGIATPKHEVELIKSRLKAVEASLGVHHDRN